LNIHTDNNKQATSFRQHVYAVVNICWPDKISNNDLWTKTDQEPVLILIKRRKWSWLGHTLRKNDNCAKFGCCVSYVWAYDCVPKFGMLGPRGV